AWSYALLDEEVRHLFRWLGVFVGGTSLDALEAITGAPKEVLLAGLTALVKASLLQVADVAGKLRYTQLVTLRAYAVGRLQEEGIWDEAGRRHAVYFREIAEENFAADWGEREEAMACVELEYENIRAALSWAWETGAITHGLYMVGALRRFWDHRSYFREGL